MTNVSVKLITLIIVLILVGFLLWLIRKEVPMQANYKVLFNIVLICLAILWCLIAFDIIDAPLFLKVFQ